MYRDTLTGPIVSINQSMKTSLLHRRMKIGRGTATYGISAGVDI